MKKRLGIRPSEPRQAPQRKLPDAKTRARLLDVAQRLFAEHGFGKVTVREICKESAANVAAINYHFGDKLGLYTEVVRGLIDEMRGMNDASMDESVGPSPQERLRHYVLVYLPRISKPLGRGTWIQKLMRHEMSKPTPLAPWIAEQAIMPRVRYLTTLMAELIECEEDDPRVQRCVVGLQAQCLFYMRDPMRASFFPNWPPQEDAELLEAAEHVAKFTLAGIEAIKTQKQRKPARASTRTR